MSENLAFIEFGKLMDWFLPALAFITLGLTVFLGLECNSAVERLSKARLEIEQKLKNASNALKFEDVSDYQARSSMQRVSHSSYRAQPERSNGQVEKIERAIRALQAWASATGEPEKTRTFEDELRRLGNKMRRENRQSEIAELAGNASDQTALALKVLLSATDRDEDPGRENDGLQQVLLVLKNLADCQFIDPNKGDLYNQSIHYPVEEPRSNGQHRKDTIASVVARGLRRSDGTVSAKAEVAVYT